MYPIPSSDPGSSQEISSWEVGGNGGWIGSRPAFAIYTHCLSHWYRVIHLSVPCATASNDRSRESFPIREADISRLWVGSVGQLGLVDSSRWRMRFAMLQAGPAAVLISPPLVSRAYACEGQTGMHWPQLPSPSTVDSSQLVFILQIRTCHASSFDPIPAKHRKNVRTAS